MAMSIVVFVTASILLSVARSAPVDKPSYGTIAADNFSNNLALINQNMYNGITGIANPLSRLAIDTAPDLIHLYAILNGVNVPPFLAALAKNMYGNVAVGGGRLVGGAAVLGSKVLESSMNVTSHGLQAGNDVIEAASRAGINLAGKMGEYVASGTSVGAEILSSGLKTAGDTMLAGSVGGNVLAKGISDVLDAIGGRLVAAISSAEKTASQLLDSGVKVLENGALQFATDTQQRLYQGLTAYVQTLTQVQSLLSLLASAVAGVGSVAAPQPTATTTTL